MANIAIFRINYKSDFILTLNSDAGWMTPFCIKFWTGAPSQAYFVGFDGTTYTHCAPVEGEPTKLRVQFDDHHLPIGDLKFQVAYHFTVADFPNDTEDEVLNASGITVELDGEPAKVMLDFTGETAPEIQFSLPAYANEAQRIENEQQRITNEEQRIAAETVRIQNEQTRIAREQIRQQNEQQRINQEQARVEEYAGLKADAVAATGAANDAAALANQKAQLAADKAALAQAAADLANAKAQLATDKAALAASAAQLANDKAALAQQKAEYAQTQGGYAKDQGDYAKDQGDYAKAQGDTALADHQRAEADHGIAVDDHTQAGNDHTRAESDHGIAVDDHTQAGNDHTRAESDHGIAVDDHTRAESDHGIAADDHTQAGNDHTRAESDHTRAESDHAAVEVYVDSLGVFDLSKHNAVGGVLATYTDLSAALTALNALESKYKYGGMSFKFVLSSVLSSDNKYVQFRCIADEFTTDTTQWVVCDEGVYVESREFIKVYTDKDDRILWAIKTDGSIYWGAGVPQQVINYVNEKISELSLDEYEDIVTFLGDFIQGNTLAELLDEKVDKVEGKSIIDSDYANGISYKENSEFIEIKTDAYDRILWAIKADGSIFYGAGVPSQILEELNKKVDKVEGKFLSSNDYTDNDKELVNIDSIVESDDYLSIETDKDSKILSAREKDGTKVENVGIKTPRIILSEEGIQELYDSMPKEDISFRLVSPYDGASFDNRVAATSHEHMYEQAHFNSAYARGIRIISSSHYTPAAPRYPMSSFSWNYDDYKSLQATRDNDFEIIQRTCSGQFPIVTVDGVDIQSDTIPQIANAERGYVHYIDNGNKVFMGHCNILGLLWATVGNDILDGNYDGLTPGNGELLGLMQKISEESLENFNLLLEDETKWQFGSEYAFGTINHRSDLNTITKYLTTCPNIFKAMELHNDSFSAGSNQGFRDGYDIVLRAGYKLWGTSVVDHQGSIAGWNFTTADEKIMWQEKYDNLPAEQKALYADARAYYTAMRPYKFDRGCNVMLMDSSYNTLTPEQKAREAIIAYNTGRYFMSALNTVGMKLTCSNPYITLQVYDTADRIYVITANEKIEYTNTDRVRYKAKYDDIYVRFEAFFDNSGEFIYTNPVWVEKNN